jgi:quercetin dioxygenase-like cupin family protein
MNTAPSASPSIVLAGEGRVLRAFGEEVCILLDGRKTNGQFTLFSEITPPGGGPPPHYHAREDEWFYVMEGRVSFFKEGQWTEVPAGTAMYMPKGVVHTFKNVGDKPLKQLITTAPSGFETFFARCEAEFARPGGPDMQRIVEISAEHGIHFVQP